MTTFDVQENVILLHGILQGMRNMLEIPATSWHDTTNDDKIRTWDMAIDMEKYGVDFQNIYDRWWQMFPFGVAEYVNLNLIQKDMVNLTINMIRELSQGYGEVLRADYSTRVQMAKAQPRD